MSDPRMIFDEEMIESQASIQIGDWVRTTSWTRPRQVVALEKDDYFVLAEPDETRQDDYRCRKVDRHRFRCGTWLRMPDLRTLWEEAGRSIATP